MVASRLIYGGSRVWSLKVILNYPEIYMEALFSISDAYHVVSTLLSLPMSNQVLEQTFKILDDVT